MKKQKTSIFPSKPGQLTKTSFSESLLEKQLNELEELLIFFCDNGLYGEEYKYFLMPISRLSYYGKEEEKN